jgi:hypothetical protein
MTCDKKTGYSTGMNFLKWKRQNALLVDNKWMESTRDTSMQKERVKKISMPPPMPLDLNFSSDILGS